MAWSWNWNWCGLLFLSLQLCVIKCRQVNGDGAAPAPEEGKRWAVLVAGSSDYDNYRHQADVCHAYQTLRKGGLQDENIIVFMYDDIAFNEYNPTPGIIFNNPLGPDVYHGVPKDYTGEDVNVHNFLAVILGNKTAVKGGTGKVLQTGPQDRVFIFYSDHGSTGYVGMPTGDNLYAKDLIPVLKAKQASMKSMVIYLEACESGSMFQGLLPNNSNIYAVTASRADENSWATYCPPHGDESLNYNACLGDLFSISWLEDSDRHDLKKEDLKKQYRVVHRRTSPDSDAVAMGSHVTQYGNLNLQTQMLASFLGFNPANDNVGPKTLAQSTNSTGYDQRQAGPKTLAQSTNSTGYDQRQASLLDLTRHLPQGSQAWAQAQQKLAHELAYRERIDYSIKRIQEALNHRPVPTPGSEAVVQDWDCYRQLVGCFRELCGTTTSRYDMQHSRVFADLCNLNVDVQKATAAIQNACLSSTHHHHHHHHHHAIHL